MDKTEELKQKFIKNWKPIQYPLSELSADSLYGEFHYQLDKLLDEYAQQVSSENCINFAMFYTNTDKDSRWAYEEKFDEWIKNQQ